MWLILVIIAACIVIYFYLSAGASPRQDDYVQSRRAPTTHEWPELGEYEFEVVGESYYQDALRSLHSSASDGIVTALLVPDDANPHDNQAVRVVVEGQTVGHLSRQDARSFRRRLAAFQLSGAVSTCKARITGGHQLRNGSQASFGLQLDLKPFS